MQGHIDYLAVLKIYLGRVGCSGRDSAEGLSPAAGFLHNVDIDDSVEGRSSAFAGGSDFKYRSCADESEETDVVVAAACAEVDGSCAAAGLYCTRMSVCWLIQNMARS